MNLLQRINEVRKLIDYVQKDRSVSAGAAGSYKAVSHDMVTAMVRDHMVTHGIVCYPSLVASEFHAPVINQDGSQSKQRLYEATYDFTFVNIDAPDDRLTVRIQAHAMDNADKAPGKAISYAKKYAVLKLFEIETGESEESRASEFDIDSHLESIRSANDLESLRTLFAKSFSAAEKDKEAQKMIIKVKDAKKAELAGAKK